MQTEFIISLAVLVVGVSCRSAQSPERCCLPTRFSANVTDLKTANNDYVVRMRISVDMDAMKQSVLIHVHDRSTGQIVTQGKSVVDYRTSTNYYPGFVHGQGLVGCHEAHFERSGLESQCISDVMHYTGSFTLGVPGSSTQMQINTWAFTSTSLNLTMSMSSPGCAPVLETLVGNMFGMPVNSVFLFETFEPDHIDAGALDLPEACYIAGPGGSE